MLFLAKKATYHEQIDHLDRTQFNGYTCIKRSGEICSILLKSADKKRFPAELMIILAAIQKRGSFVQTIHCP